MKNIIFLLAMISLVVFIVSGGYYWVQKIFYKDKSEVFEKLTVIFFGMYVVLFSIALVIENFIN